MKPNNLGTPNKSFADRLQPVIRYLCETSLNIEPKRAWVNMGLLAAMGYFIVRLVIEGMKL